METVALNPDFWRGKRVFLTGHTGFKGAWLSLWLRSLGAQVTGYALTPPTDPSLFVLARLDDMDSVIADIRDLDRLTTALVSADPHVVFHLAAQSLVRSSYKSPVETFATNVMGTAHVLEAARRGEALQAVVVVTSDKCYDNREWPWAYRENEAMGGRDPYSASKGCAELVAAAYRHSFANDDKNFALATARAGNVIGGGDWAADRLMPDVVRAVSAGTPLRLRNPNAIRPWQHVLDALHGYLILAQSLCRDKRRFAEAWNFGPWEHDTCSVGAFATRALKSWTGDGRWIHDRAEHSHEANVLKLDSAKARGRLGWRPRLDSAAAIDWTVEWHRSHAASADMRALTLKQIEKFQTLA